MSRRLLHAKRGATMAVGVAVVIGMPTFGVWYSVPLILAAAVFWVGQLRLDHSRRPEYVLAASWVFAQVMFGVAVGVAHGPRLYLLALFILPLLLWSLAFPTGAAAGAVGLTALLMVATAFITDPATVLHTPFALMFPVAWMVATSIPSAAVRDLDAHSRQTAVVDQLTGLLNRVALDARAAELTHQTTAVAGTVALVIGDVDHFKSINDTHGHPHGDAVLKEIAGRLSASLDHDPVFRLGGEEFVVLLAGLDEVSARHVAERLRRSVADAPIAGLPVTMSFGVACSQVDEPLQYDRLFTRADGALYAAKNAGRDRVAVAPRLVAAPPLPLAPVPVAELAMPERRHRAANGTSALALVSGEALRTTARERLDDEHEESGSWLVRDRVAREHLIDLARRVHQHNRPAYVVAFATVLAAAPTYGWITIVAPLLAAIAYNVVEHLLDRFRRPEYALGVMWLLAQAANGLGLVALRASSARAPLYALPVMAIMVVSSSATFPRRGAVIGVTFTVLVTIVAAVLVNPTLVAQAPGIIAITVALVVSAGLIGSAAGQSAVDHRGASVLDQLTGMLNRGALQARVAELTHHATAVGQQVAVIVADLDHFKAVNDTYGHSRGDEVLQAVAYRIRKHLRAFESAYRVGGEEFVVLLPGVTSDDAQAIARRIWAAVRDELVGDLQVTMSLGLAGSEPGAPFDYARLFGQADAALYRAKQSGRDRVCCDGAYPSSLAA